MIRRANWNVATHEQDGRNGTREQHDVEPLQIVGGLRHPVGRRELRPRWIKVKPRPMSRAVQGVVAEEEWVSRCLPIDHQEQSNRDERRTDLPAKRRRALPGLADKGELKGPDHNGHQKGVIWANGRGNAHAGPDTHCRGAYSTRLVGCGPHREGRERQHQERERLRMVHFARAHEEHVWTDCKKKRGSSGGRLGGDASAEAIEEPATRPRGEYRIDDPGRPRGVADGEQHGAADWELREPSSAVRDRLDGAEEFSMRLGLEPEAPVKKQMGLELLRHLVRRGWNGAKAMPRQVGREEQHDRR